ncbi:hypothetical protein ACQPZZ_36320 [Microbispora sp. CA-135349]|uniref:hypothetical protein n=1 Tax=Microbispora sp. CA-135349 TaxID=3239953 RepID=UPI003D93A80F
MWRIPAAIGVILGVYLIARAVVEPFVIDMSDPATYRNDWGGPSLGAVLLVHLGPGIVSAAVLGWALTRRRRRLRGENR